MRATAPRLSVNIDHVATIRNARGGAHPDPATAARLAIDAGADGITAHLREDRRHIRDDDIARIMEAIKGRPLNFEMAATDEMLAIALEVAPAAACIVPEKREEITTEGGLDVAGAKGASGHLAEVVSALKEKGIRASLFIEPERAQIEAAAKIAPDAVELHTGAYCNATGKAREAELTRIAKGAVLVESLGLECHAGHGLCFETVGAISACPQIAEVSIGHFIIGEAVMMGLGDAVRQMRRLMDEGAKNGGEES